jgi:hypothetical protein
MKNILIILACLVGGYVIVSMLMNVKADDLRPPPKRGEPPPLPGHDAPPALPAPGPARTTQRQHTGDWSLLLDIPRDASPRDIEAAFKRQLRKAEADGDPAMIERLKRARETALAGKRHT